MKFVIYILLLPLFSHAIPASKCHFTISSSAEVSPEIEKLIQTIRNKNLSPESTFRQIHLIKQNHLGVSNKASDYKRKYEESL